MDAQTTRSDAPQAPAEKRELTVAVTPKAVLKAKEALVKRGTPTAMLRLGVRGCGESFTV